MHHCHVFHRPGGYGGWPANGGIWSWNDEIVVGFTMGYMDPDPESATGHPIDTNRPRVTAHARSLDGGESWTIEEPDLPSPKKDGYKPPSSIDFTHPDFALKAIPFGSVDAGGTSGYYVSYDRCRTWDGPFEIPMMGQPGIAARTDYQVLSKDQAILFLTGAKDDGCEGRSFCARTDDGGLTWDFLSVIGPEPKRWSIMPSSVLLDNGRLVVALRQRKDWESYPDYVDCYASDDMGLTWSYLSTPAPDVGEGNPASMIRLENGRICIVYGYRKEPSGIRARLSDDDGKSWGDEIILKEDGGGYDLGYPRIVQRSDGCVVATYYFHDTPYGERYIGGTIFDPDEY